MRITHLSLTNFRNYSRLELPLQPGIIVLHGDNAQGKTSLLESIYYLATSRSPHITADRQLINWLADKDPLPHARMVADVKTRVGSKRVEMTLLNDPSGRSTRFKKDIRINGLPRRVMDLLGQITVVMFLPQDLSLIEGRPALRRRYLNITLCQTNAEYAHALNQYEHVLTQRNALLRQFQVHGKRFDSGQLEFWDEKLATSGALIVAGRNVLIKELESRAQRIHRELSGDDEHLRLRYQPGFDDAPDTPEQMAFIDPDPSTAARTD